MTTLVFSDYAYAPLVFNALVATPDMANSKKFHPVTVTGATDFMMPSNIYVALEKDNGILAYAIKFADGHVVPLAIPVKRSKLMPLYKKLSALNVAPEYVHTVIGNEPKTVEELMTFVAGK